MNEKFEKYRKWAMVGLIATVGLIVAPVIYIAVKGLIGLAIAGLIGISFVSFSPYIAMKFANWKVAAIKKEAGENPIETMTNLLIAKREAFELFRKNVSESMAARDTFEQKCRDFARRYPSRASEFEAQLSRMKALVEQKRNALIVAKEQLDLGDNKLDEMRAYWEMSQHAANLNKAAGMDTGDLYEKLKADTAVDAVFMSMNSAFAELEVAAALIDDDEPKLLERSENDQSILTFNVNQKEKVVV